MSSKAVTGFRAEAVHAMIAGGTMAMQASNGCLASLEPAEDPVLEVLASIRATAAQVNAGVWERIALEYNTKILGGTGVLYVVCDELPCCIRYSFTSSRSANCGCM